MAGISASNGGLSSNVICLCTSLLLCVRRFGYTVLLSNLHIIKLSAFSLDYVFNYDTKSKHSVQ